MPAEWTRLCGVLHSQPDRIRIYFTLLLIEGPRMSEARRMEWSHLDLGARLWRKPRTKNGRAHIIALTDAACALLAELPRDGRFVFHGQAGHTGSRPEQPWSRTAVQYHWRRIRELADLRDVQIRDLRRTCASWLAMQGTSTVTIQQVLNHSNLRCMNVYARLDQTSVRAALERLAAIALEGSGSI